MKKFFYLLCLSLTLFACKERQETAVENRDAAVPQAREPYTEDLLVGTFSGMVPCKDCKGISMTLALRQDNTYTLVEEFQRAQPEQVKTEGTWTLRDKGEKLQLVQTGATNARDFDVVSQNSIKLDIPVDEREHDEEAYTLTRVSGVAVAPAE